MQKFLRASSEYILSQSGWKKLAYPTVGRGLTAYPKTSGDLQRLGIRYDYDGEITGQDGIVYHKFQMQANAGDDIPNTIKNWRAANGGTHSIMADVYVKKDGGKEDVRAALEVAHKGIKGS